MSRPITGEHIWPRGNQTRLLFGAVQVVAPQFSECLRTWALVSVSLERWWVQKHGAHTLITNGGEKHALEHKAAASGWSRVGLG